MTGSINLPEGLDIAVHRVTIEAVDAMDLSGWTGNALRGGFGAAFKATACLTGDRARCAARCAHGNQCPYGYIFETRLPADAPVLRNLDEIPRPFVLEPPSGERTRYAPGEALSFGLTLFGRAVDFLTYFLVAFQKLGAMGLGRNRARFTLARVDGVHPWTGAEVLLYEGGRQYDAELRLRASDLLRRADALPVDRLTVHYLTPARLRHEGKFMRRDVPFHVLVRALLRRVSSLAAFHGAGVWETDYRGWAERARDVATAAADLRWDKRERYSRRQARRMELGGVVGTVVYSGDLAPYRPLLALGELTHVGKAVVFGNGQIRVEAVGATGGAHGP
ncbi:MAG: CRISPR system precrRNA processing endoribonuclease RAMP protein Cas6 [Anaerolineae bacterium]